MQGSSRYDFICPTCRTISLDVWARFGKIPVLHCTKGHEAAVQMVRYYGKQKDMLINFGYSESRGHGDIEKFQFQNL